MFFPFYTRVRAELVVFTTSVSRAVDVGRLRRMCTGRPGITNLTSLHGGGSVGAICLRNVRNSYTSLFTSMSIGAVPKVRIFVLGSLRRTKCFCRSLIRISKRTSILFFPSSCHHTVGCKRGSTTGRVLHARILDELRRGGPIAMIACPRTLTRGIISQGQLSSTVLALGIKRRRSAIGLVRALSGCKFRRISCICRPKRFTLHNDVLSICSFTSRCPCQVSFFKSRVSDLHAFRMRARLSGRGGSSVYVMPRLSKARKTSVYFLSFISGNTAL